MWGLDEMRASLSDAQRTALDQTKRAAAAILAQTHGVTQADRAARLAFELRLELGSNAEALAENAETVAHASASFA